MDNITRKKATLIKVDSINKHGSLLEVVQVLIDLNLVIKRAYISSDGEWFMDVFHVVDQEGNKLYDSEVIERIQQESFSKSNVKIWLDIIWSVSLPHINRPWRHYQKKHT